MLKFEQDNVKNCVDELLALGNNNMKMWNIFQWLATHDELQHNTQAEVIKLYIDNELAAYSLFENYQARTDKITLHQGTSYQDLGVIHFITLEQHRNQGYATQLANAMHEGIIAPLLALYQTPHCPIHAYVTATGRAGPLMERTHIPAIHLVKQFYSDASFEKKVVNYFGAQNNTTNRT